MIARNLVIGALLTFLLAGCGAGGGVKDSDDTGPSAAQINMELGIAYMRRGDNETALEKLQKAVKLDPQLAEAQTSLAVLYERIGETNKAGEHYKRAAELAPKRGDVQNNYGTFLCRQGKYKEADEHFQRALDDPFYKTPEVAYTNAGACAARIPAPERAEKYFRSALQVDPEYSEALLRLSRMMYKSGRYMDARAFMERFMSTGQATAESLALGASIERELGDSKAAERYTAQLHDQFPDSPEAREEAEQTSND